jgi:hypothetical protein
MSAATLSPPGCIHNDADLRQKAIAGQRLATVLLPVVAKTGSGLAVLIEDVQTSLQAFITASTNASVASALRATNLTRESICGNLGMLADTYAKLTAEGLGTDRVKPTLQEMAVLRDAKDAFDKVVYSRARDIALACTLSAGLAILGFALWRLSSPTKREPEPEPYESLSPAEELLEPEAA